MVVALKYNEDDYFSNFFYAKVRGIKPAEINKLEYEFISLIHFNLYVTEEVFNKYNTYLISAHENDDEEEEDEEEEDEKDASNQGENEGEFEINTNIKPKKDEPK